MVESEATTPLKAVDRSVRLSKATNISEIRSVFAAVCSLLFARQFFPEWQIPEVVNTAVVLIHTGPI